MAADTHYVRSARDSSSRPCWNGFFTRSACHLVYLFIDETKPMNGNRIRALILRHLFLYRRSLPRLMEIFYWPLLDLVVWGFITVYLNQFKSGLPSIVAFFIGALILWDILFRAQQGITISFLEEIWSRNLMNIFASPVKPGEFLAATMTISLCKVGAVLIVSVLVAWAFYSFNLFILGISLIPFIFNLIIMGWSIGILTTAIIMRYGQEAEVMAWGMVFLFQPVSCVFYPVSVLPGFLEAIAQWIPSSHVFEGMRSVITDNSFPLKELIWASGLNALYLLAAILWFHYMYNVVREKGILVRVGE